MDTKHSLGAIVLFHGVLALLGLALVAALSVTWIVACVYLSRAKLAGKLSVVGIASKVTLNRDQNGIPTVVGSSRGDVAFGLGFLHAQERYFQMDMTRRAAAGELAELLGEAFLPTDRKTRVHQFRKRAARIVLELDGPDRELLCSYTAGVRAGLNALYVRPIEYWLLRSRPAEWLEEDSILVVFNLYRVLQDERADQSFNKHLLNTVLPRGVTRFLTPEGSPDWDAPLLGQPVGSVPMPSAAELDFRHQRPRRVPDLNLRSPPTAGSNAWALGGQHTTDGRAIVANDLHLPFQMPGTFYRATLNVKGGLPVVVRGITAPGFPFVIAGDNGHVAWGLTNAAVAAVDLIAVDQQACAPEGYRTADGIRPIVKEFEEIRVRNKPAQTLEIQTTVWGPITRRTRDGVCFAHSWTAYDGNAVNCCWRSLETATTAKEALNALTSIQAPTLAVVVGDCNGDVGWTLAGALRIPRPTHWHDSASWPTTTASERLPKPDYPQVLSPTVSRVWAANAKAFTAGPWSEVLSSGYHSCGARAAQIRDTLLELENADVATMRRIQLDCRALFLQRWHVLLRGVLGGAALRTHAHTAQALRVVASWNGTADAESSAYRLIRGFRDVVERLVFEPFIALVRARHGTFNLASVTDQLETPLWQLIRERPTHLLAPWFPHWDALLEAAALETLNEIPAHADLGTRVWGQVNVLAMKHPLSGLFPGLGRWLDAPRVPLDGDLNIPLAQTSLHGPVVRFVVSPGAGRDATLQIAGSQSSNPASPYYLAGHQDWLRGAAVPLDPGPTRHRLELESA